MYALRNNDCDVFIRKESTHEFMVIFLRICDGIPAVEPYGFQRDGWFPYIRPFDVLKNNRVYFGVKNQRTYSINDIFLAFGSQSFFYVSGELLAPRLRFDGFYCFVIRNACILLFAIRIDLIEEWDFFWKNKFFRLFVCGLGIILDRGCYFFPVGNNSLICFKVVLFVYISSLI